MKKIVLFLFFICGVCFGNVIPNSVNIRIDYVKKKLSVSNDLDKKFKLKIISEETKLDGTEIFREADFFEIKKGKYNYSLRFKNITKLSEREQIRDIKKTDVINDSIIIYTSIKPSYEYKGSKARNIKYRILSNMNSGGWLVSFNSYKKPSEFYNVIGLPVDDIGNYIYEELFPIIPDSEFSERIISKFPVKYRK